MRPPMSARAQSAVVDGRKPTATTPPPEDPVAFAKYIYDRRVTGVSRDSS